MRRDLDLLRNILLRIEELSSGSRFISIRDFLDLNQDPAVISYHLSLLADADMISYSDTAYFQDFPDYDITRLTMYGCEYLDSVRNKGTWQATKTRLKSVGGGAALDVVKALAVAVMKSKLGI